MKGRETVFVSPLRGRDFGQLLTANRCWNLLKPRASLKLNLQLQLKQNQVTVFILEIRSYRLRAVPPSKCYIAITLFFVE